MNGTIVAQSTPSGSGAIALIRLTGEQAIECVDTFARLTDGSLLSSKASHTVHLGWVVNATGEHVDQVFFILLKAPKTFTGEDTVEISCHNNPFIIQAIIDVALHAGARLAARGEFTRRAFEHGKVTLTQAEAINELITAQTEQALKKSLAQLEGSFSHWIELVEQRLLTALAWCEASFELSEEEVDIVTSIIPMIAEIQQLVADVKKNFDVRTQIKQGVRIALIGTVNAGKSSLFNALLNQKRSIVTEVAGTTRDTVEASLHHKGVFWTLIDTAGIRETDDLIEQEGIKRSLEEAARADLILLVVDSAFPLSQEAERWYRELLALYGQKIILVRNKMDKIPAGYATGVSAHPEHALSDPPRQARDKLRGCIEWVEAAQMQALSFPEYQKSINVSTLTGSGCDLLEREIEVMIEQLFEKAQAPFLINQRHYTILLTVEQELQAIDELLQYPVVAFELVAYRLRETLEVTSSLTGKSISEEALNKVFQEFCVGK